MAEKENAITRNKKKILITRPDMPKSALDLLKDYELDIWDKESPIPKDIFLQKVAEKDALFIYSGNQIDTEILEAAGKNLKVIATLSVGYDHIQVDEVKKRGIKLGYTSEVLTDAVAELAVGLLLSTTRRLYEARKAMDDGIWTTWTKWTWMNGFGLKNSVIGVLGLGKVGMEIAKRLVAFKPSKILYMSRKSKAEAVNIGAEKVPIERLMRESDVVIVSLSLNEETKGMVNEEMIGIMKRNAFIVNVSRGAVIQQEALVKALKEKRIGGAALDVMVPEPLPANHELYSITNCSLSPHIGSAEVTTRIEMAELTARNILAGLTGSPLPSEL